MATNQKFFIDRNRLKGKMAETSMTRNELAVFLGISYGGLMKKMNNGGSFSESEIEKLSRLFGDYIFLK